MTSLLDLLAQTARYKLPGHWEFMCHMCQTKINPHISDKLFDRGVAMDNYAVMKSEAIKADVCNKARDNEWQLQGHLVGKGQPSTSSLASSTTATKTSTGTAFSRQGQPMDLSQAKLQGLCCTCHQKGHVSHNCPQKAMVCQILGEMSEAECTELVHAKEE